MCSVLKLGERLSELMIDADNFTSNDLAKSVGVSVQTVNRWKRGESLMLLSKIISVSNVFHCTIDFLVGRNNSAIDFIPQECPQFYKRLREVMVERGISWYKLTKETNIKDSYLYSWKKGSDIKIPALIELADYFDVTIDYLVGRDR